MKKYFQVITGMQICLALFISSCQKEISRTEETQVYDSGISQTNQAEEKKKYVSNVTELYAAVNDEDNAGFKIVLAPGTYLLDASYPNDGRLELKHNMSLQGLPGRADAVVIDQSSLPNNSYRLTPTVSTGGIRVGNGSNAIEWLTLIGGAQSANPFSIIETDLNGNESSLLLSNVNIECNGSRIGLMLRNRLPEHTGRIINATVEFCEISGAVNTLGFGIAIQNRISGSQVNLNMKQNYLHGNKIGILSFNGGLGNSIENCKVEITSHKDRIEGNGCGLDPSGATNGSASTSANSNSFVLKMYGSSVRDNHPAGHPELIPTNGALPGGIYVAAGYNSLNSVTALNTISFNTAILQFWGCDISNNNAPDFYAYGLFSATNAVLAGTNNLTQIHLHGTSNTASVAGYDSNPPDPSGTNKVQVFRN